MEIKYIHDTEVNMELDSAIKQILCTCFDEQPIFKMQRYYYELPQHRWVIYEEGKIIGHTALHEKEILLDEKKIKLGGIAEVCVHPDFRGKGLVKVLLHAAHDWLRKNDYKFALLIANHPNVYSPSGYFVINNMIRYYLPEFDRWEIKTFPEESMVVQLGDEKWNYNALVDLNGPKF